MLFKGQFKTFLSFICLIIFTYLSYLLKNSK